MLISKFCSLLQETLEYIRLVDARKIGSITTNIAIEITKYPKEAEQFCAAMDARLNDKNSSYALVIWINELSKYAVAAQSNEKTRILIAYDDEKCVYAYKNERIKGDCDDKVKAFICQRKAKPEINIHLKKYISYDVKFDDKVIKCLKQSCDKPLPTTQSISSLLLSVLGTHPKSLTDKMSTTEIIAESTAKSSVVLQSMASSWMATNASTLSTTTEKQIYTSSTTVTTTTTTTTTSSQSSSAVTLTDQFETSSMLTTTSQAKMTDSTLSTTQSFSKFDYKTESKSFSATTTTYNILFDRSSGKEHTSTKLMSSSLTTSNWRPSTIISTDATTFTTLKQESTMLVQPQLSTNASNNTLSSITSTPATETSLQLTTAFESSTNVSKTNSETGSILNWTSIFRSELSSMLSSAASSATKTSSGIESSFSLTSLFKSSVESSFFTITQTFTASAIDNNLTHLSTTLEIFKYDKTKTTELSSAKKVTTAPTLTKSSKVPSTRATTHSTTENSSSFSTPFVPPLQVANNFTTSNLYPEESTTGTETSVSISSSFFVAKKTSALATTLKTTASLASTQTTLKTVSTTVVLVSITTTVTLETDTPTTTETASSMSQTSTLDTAVTSTEASSLRSTASAALTPRYTSVPKTTLLSLPLLLKSTHHKVTFTETFTKTIQSATAISTTVNEECRHPCKGGDWIEGESYCYKFVHTFSPNSYEGALEECRKYFTIINKNDLENVNDLRLLQSESIDFTLLDLL
uniref:C-type lectin domain-containing protein n=1 Tax=Syphacia muris TaxID=451379 RepID=A0A0N5ASJ1_9BILA